MSVEKSSIVARLRSAGCVFAEDEADVLFAAARDDAELEHLIAQRIDGLPLAHVVGWAELAGVRVAVEPGVFVPRPRTALLVEEAVRRVGLGAIVLDICCGSGAVGVAIAAAIEQIELHAADIDEAAVRCALRNVPAAGGTVYEGDLYEPLPASLRGRVDAIVANAPYVPTDALHLMPRDARLFEPTVSLDGGEGGVDVQRRICGGSRDWLRPGGHLLIETSESQGEATAALMAAAGLRTEVVHCDMLDATVLIGTSPGSPGSL